MSRSHLPATESSHASRPRGPFFARPSGRRHADPPPFFQPKLTIGAPGDRFEQEADRVADRVVAGETAPEVQRMCAGCAQEGEQVRRQPMEEEEEMLQPKTATEPRPIVIGSAQPDTVQREESEGDGKEDKDPLAEGAKLTAGKVLEKPEVKQAVKDVWESLPPKAQVGLMTVGGVSLGIAYLTMILSPKVREEFSGASVGKPLSLIPYVPLENFKYTLATASKPGVGLSAEFAFDDYFSLIRRHYPRFPITNLTFGLEGTVAPGGGFGLTGGKAALELFGGALKAEGKSFTSLSPYPMIVPGAGPLDPPSTLMQSYPELPSTQTGLGGQFMLSVDLAKIFPGVLGGGITPRF